MGEKSEFKKICARLNHYEQEPAGITTVDATAFGFKLFPEEKYPIKNTVELLFEYTANLEQKEEIVGDANVIATCICLLLNIMSRGDSFTEPSIFLWGKYMHNVYRFNGLMLHEEPLSKSDFLAEMEKSKLVAKNAGWNDREAFIRFYDYLYNDGWYYYEELQEIYPRPIGTTDLHLYQLVTQHFLLLSPNTFSKKELFELLLGELQELKFEISKSEQDKWDIAFEAADVIIYLLHLASEFGIDVSEAIKNLDKATVSLKYVSHSNNE